MTGVAPNSAASKSELSAEKPSRRVVRSDASFRPKARGRPTDGR